jgi:DNA-directed RNA polymerase subunit RPC12/RpoP
MIYHQELYGWKECEISCIDCGNIIKGLYHWDNETGINTYSDNMQDKLSEPCPECGGKMVDNG